MRRTTGPQSPRAHERDKFPAAPRPDQPAVGEELDEIDEEGAESFPASDPPSASVPTTLGGERPPGRESRP